MGPVSCEREKCYYHSFADFLSGAVVVKAIRGLQIHIIKGGRHDMVARLPFVDEIAQIAIDFFSSSPG